MYTHIHIYIYGCMHTSTPVYKQDMCIYMNLLTRTHPRMYSTPNTSSPTKHPDPKVVEEISQETADSETSQIIQIGQIQKAPRRPQRRRARGGLGPEDSKILQAAQTA